jgi:WD40 repeat protein
VDGSVQIWDRGNADRPVVRVAREWLSGAPVFSTDGQSVFFASQDGTVRVLPLGSTPADTDLMQINQVVGPVHVRATADGKTEVSAFSGSGEFKSVVLEPPAADQPTGRGFRPSGGNSPGESKKK